MGKAVSLDRILVEMMVVGWAHMWGNLLELKKVGMMAVVWVDMMVVLRELLKAAMSDVA